MLARPAELLTKTGIRITFDSVESLRFVVLEKQRGYFGGMRYAAD